MPAREPNSRVAGDEQGRSRDYILATNADDISFADALDALEITANTGHFGDGPAVPGMLKPLAGLFLAGYLGLSLPVLGIGFGTLAVSLQVALAAFAVLVGAVIAVSSIVLRRQM